MTSNQPESGHVEYKLCQLGKLPDNLWEPLTGFSNGEGGSIYFGYDNAGRKIGLPIEKIDEMQQNLVSQCRSEFNHQLYPDVTVDEDTIIAYIPPAPAVMRPIYSKKRGIKSGAKVRIGSVNVDLDDKFIRSFAAAAQGGAELNIIEYDYEENLDRAIVDDYKQAVYKKRGEVYQGLHQEEILIKLRAITSDRKLTLFGLLAFGKNTKLQDLISPTVNVAVTQYIGATKINELEPSQTSLDDKEFFGNVVSQYKDSLQFILSKLPVEGVVGPGGVRQDYLKVPEEAIREILANAVAHRDYSSFGSRIQIDIYSDRIEFSNPGRSLVPLSMLEQAHPQTRNPLLMNFLKDMGLTEQRGRGIVTIKTSLQKAGLAEPRFEHRHDWFVATIYTSAFISEGDNQWLSTLNSYNLNERQRKALVFLKHHTEGITNSQYRSINNMNNVGDDRKASWELKRLTDFDLVVKIGTRKQTKYRMNIQK